MFLQCFPSKTPKFARFSAYSRSKNTGFCSVFKAPASKNLQFPDLPKPLKTPLFTLFSSIFACANAAGQLKHIYKNHSKTLFFFQCFYIFFRQKHYNLHVFRQLVGPKHWFLQCFRCSGIQKPFKILLFTVFFHLCPFFHCRKPTKMTQNSISIPSYAQTPKNRRKNTQTPPIPGLGAKSFLPPPS